MIDEIILIVCAVLVFLNWTTISHWSTEWWFMPACVALVIMILFRDVMIALLGRVIKV